VNNANQPLGSHKPCRDQESDFWCQLRICRELIDFDVRAARYVENQNAVGGETVDHFLYEYIFEMLGPRSKFVVFREENP
jgi:hypothetical protein